MFHSNIFNRKISSKKLLHIHALESIAPIINIDTNNMNNIQYFNILNRFVLEATIEYDYNYETQIEWTSIPELNSNIIIPMYHQGESEFIKAKNISSSNNRLLQENISSVKGL